MTKMTLRKRKELRVLLCLAVFAARNQQRRIRQLVRSKDFKGVSHSKVRETLLQLHLFAGFPVAIESFATLHPFVQFSDLADISPNDRKERGTKLCMRVYGKNYDRLVTHLCSLSKNLSDWIIEDGYGKVLSRKGISLVERELIAIAVLAALGLKRQLKSHIIGAINAGATIHDLNTVHSLLKGIVVSRRTEYLRDIVTSLNLGENT
jgi:4-carboxymuconolactone decarboxylase